MNTQWSWREDGGSVAGHHVPSQQKWHMTGFGWNGVILGSHNNEMNERTAPYNQKTTGVFLISQHWDFYTWGLKATSLGPAVR